MDSCSAATATTAAFGVAAGGAAFVLTVRGAFTVTPSVDVRGSISKVPGGLALGKALGVAGVGAGITLGLGHVSSLGSRAGCCYLGSVLHSQGVIDGDGDWVELGYRVCCHDPRLCDRRGPCQVPSGEFLAPEGIPSGS